MNNKVRHAFALFFVLFLVICSFPVLFAIVQNIRNGAIRGYDTWMKNRKIKVVQPKKKIKSPYGEKLPKHPPVVQPKKKVYSDSKYSIIRKYDAFSKLMLPERKHVEQWAINAFPFRDEFSTFNMAFKYHLGMVKPLEQDNEILLKDSKNGDRLAVNTVVPDRYSKKSLTLFKSYKSVCKKNNISFFVVLRPQLISIYENNWEPYNGLVLKHGDNLSKRAEILRGHGIDTVELWKEMAKEIPEDKFLDYFFRTDHHWKVDGALMGGKILANHMNKNYDTSYNLTYFDPDIYIRKIWKNVFFGSCARRLTPGYIDEKENFDLLYPRFKTSFTITIPSKKYMQKGSFSIFLYPGQIHYDSLHKNSYNAFMEANEPFVRIVNNKIKSGKKIAILKDSFGLPLVPYLALQTKEILLFDPRLMSHEEIRKMLNEEQPDIFFVLYYAGF